MCNIPILLKKDLTRIESHASWLHHKREKEEMFVYHAIRRMNPEIRTTIKQRDKICRLCGSDKDMHVHHIKGRMDYPELVNDIGNLVLLCIECHDFVHDGLLLRMEQEGY